MFQSCLQSCVLTEQGRGRTPYMLHKVIGQDMREAASSSFFNPVELIVVLDYIAKLMDDGVDPKDIGEITPCRLGNVRPWSHS